MASLSTPGIPVQVRAALDTLGAPALPDLSAVTRWARTGLTCWVFCDGTPPPSGPRAGSGAGSGAGLSAERVRHQVRVDPHSGASAPMLTADQPARDIAEHFMRALAGGPPPLVCTIVGEVLRDRFGPAGSLSCPTGWAETEHERLAAIRTVARAVQYHDAGLDPTQWGPWLAVGLSVANAQYVTAVAAERPVGDLAAALYTRFARRPFPQRWTETQTNEDIGYWLLGALDTDAPARRARRPRRTP